jgi:hypothetical protein
MTMAGILGSIFGNKFPDTEKYEAAQNRLREDYKKFREIEESALWHRYQELDREVHSGEFENRVNELKNKKFRDTNQYKQLKRFEELIRSKDIKTYLKLNKSGKGQQIQKILESDKYKKFQDLEKYINSSNFHKEKSGSDFKETDAYSSFKEFKVLKKDPEIKMAVKSEKSSGYKTFKKLKGSERIDEYYALESTIESDKFKEFKALMEDRNRFKKSDEAALLKEFSELEKNTDIVWFLRNRGSSPFEELKKWEATFVDNFNSPTLDTNKWITGYYWGKALLNDAYSMEGEKQLFTDSNIELRDSMLKITTQKETIKGKVWNPAWGFREKEFEYTSGLISTGQSFRQQYGRFEAKIRFNRTFPVVNAFWMIGERMTPHIDIFKSMYPGEKQVAAGIISDASEKSMAESVKTVKGARFCNNFFIYSLDWTENELVWKINGIEVHRQTQNIPKEPMYLTFSSTIPEEPKDKDIPATMEICWVRCYKRN